MTATQRNDGPTDRPSADGPLVELRGVTRSFADGPGRRTVLDGVDLSVRAGELVAVMG
jgi:ABC-type transporter Mla maintaining outer membrane lipid asymmetry ATPase subunit MlaF